jgi:hypothetical protein
VYVRLKEDTQIDVWYRGDEWNEPRHYPKDTIFMGDLKFPQSNLLYVYLDDDGDGEIYIPMELLEKLDETPWKELDKVIGD